MEPLAFAILKGLTPPDVETVLHDERLAPIPVDEPTDLVAMTVETYTARRAYGLAREYRRRGVPVVMGGYHPTFLPEEAGSFADVVVRGDAEQVWGRVVADFRRQRMEPQYDGKTFGSLRGARVDRSIFDGKSYAPIGMVQYGRGCKFNCDFCSIRTFYGSSLRQRPVSEVLEEIERLDRRIIFFVDDNLFVDADRARELFQALIPLNILWFSQTSIDVARDPGLVELMRRSGCLGVLIGFESLRPENLKQMRKGWNTKFGGYEHAVRLLHDSGIMLYGTFVFGYDHDTLDAFDEALDFSIRHKLYLANFNPLTPMPGTPLEARLRREGQLIHDRWWFDPDYRYGQATFHPRGMSAEELTRGCYETRRRFNSYASIVGRLLDVRTHLRSPRRLGVYLLSNLISRREIHSKQGIQLGDSAALARLA